MPLHPSCESGATRAKHPVMGQLSRSQRVRAVPTNAIWPPDLVPWRSLAMALVRIQTNYGSRRPRTADSEIQSSQ